MLRFRSLGSRVRELRPKVLKVRFIGLGSGIQVPGFWVHFNSDQQFGFGI